MGWKRRLGTITSTAGSATALCSPAPEWALLSVDFQGLLRHGQKAAPVKTVCHQEYLPPHPWEHIHPEGLPDCMKLDPDLPG